MTAGARILMVDDDPGIRDVVSDFLGRHGYKVDTAGDAREMEQALERGPVDLIVLDVMLPGEDGLAICRRLTTGEGSDKAENPMDRSGEIYRGAPRRRAPFNLRDKSRS